MYYYVNGKVFKASDLDTKRKAMFEDRGFKQLTEEELKSLTDKYGGVEV